MLIKLYSETNLLVKDVPFGPGINVILGKYSGVKDANGINGIGKSSLIRLINYCFISNSAEKIFSQTKYDFLRKENHNVVLHFRMQQTEYFIKRFFSEPNIIYFGKANDVLEQYDKAEIRKLLTNILFPIVNESVAYEGNRYGTLLNFFIKDDLQSQKRFDPLNFLGYSGPSQKDIAAYNFFLLNLPTRDILKYGQISNEYDEKYSAIKEMERTIKATTGKSVEEFKTEKLHVDARVALLEKSLNDYNFLEKYKDTENELIELTKQINTHLQSYHIHQHELKRLKELYNYEVGIDTNQIQKIFNETLATFGDLVKKSLDEVIGFKRNILSNRSKFLLKKENEL